MTSPHRERLRVAIAGHVDHGKSTVLGRLLADSGALPEGKLAAVKSYCERNSKPFEYAFLLDAMKDEQSQGITIDAARVFLKTERRDYLLIDAPGHVEFIKNMVSGASEAAAALLVVDAKEGLKENSRRHGYLLSLLGVRQIAVLVNKMDLVGFEERAFQDVRERFREFLGGVGIDPHCFVPVSGLNGDNITSPSRAMPWHGGPTVLEALEAFKAPRPALDRPFRMPVQDVYKFSAKGDERRIVAGSVVSGRARPGMTAVFHPSGKSSAIKTVEGFPPESEGGARPRAEAGLAAGFTLAEQLYLRRGEMMSLSGEPPPRVSRRLRASVFWLGLEPLRPGRGYVLKAGAAKIPVRLEKVERALDAASMAPREKPSEVRRHEAAECVLELDSPLAFDLAADNLPAGRFVLVDGYDISGGGLIREALPERRDWMRERVVIRNAKWQKSSIPSSRREERYGQKAAMVLVTGPRDSKRKEIARALEARLFEAGRWTYFLAIGSVLYGVDADIRDGAPDHEEDVRRLAEVAHIALDAGLILIVSAAELSRADLEIIETATAPARVETVWAGARPPEGLDPSLQVPDSDVAQAVQAVEARLRERGIIA